MHITHTGKIEEKEEEDEEQEEEDEREGEVTHMPGNCATNDPKVSGPKGQYANYHSLGPRIQGPFSRRPSVSPEVIIQVSAVARCGSTCV